MEKKDEQTIASNQETKKQITKIKREIRKLEQNRMRSMADLMEAVVDGAEFNKRDVDFFKTLTSMIRLNREKLQILKDSLKEED